MDFEIIIQECSFGDCLQKLPKPFRSVEQEGPPELKIEKPSNDFSSLFSDIEIIIQECSLGDCLPKLLKPFRSVEQNGR